MLLAVCFAAVGTNGETIALIVALSSGLSVGVNVLIAQQIGQRKNNNVSSIVRSAMSLAVMIGVIGFLIGQCISSPLLSLIKTPADILGSSTLYLRIYFCSYPFLMLYDFGSAILRAHGNSRYPFIVLTFSGIANVFLNIIFVVLFRFIIPILKIGIPSAIQGAVFCFANIFVQASVNRFGSYAIAGSTIAMNFEYFVYYVITAFGQTATTFISQNHAAGKNKRCWRILWTS